MRIEFYRTTDGKCPVQDYLDTLNSKQAAKITWTLQAIKMTYPMPSLYFQKMVNTQDLWEVRVIFAGDIFRLLGWICEGPTLMLAHGFTKKTQKTPSREISTAEARKKDYEN